MTRRIRKLHLLVWALLAVLLPALFFAAIGLRHAEPVNRSIPARNLQTR